MSQPVKLSDALVLDARLAGEAQQRSIAGQVEFWARLGRSLDELLEGRAKGALKESVERRSLSKLVSSVGTTEGKARLKVYLDSRPFPHFEPHPARKGFLVRIEQDGTRSVGRFVNRQFVKVREGEASRTHSVRDIVDQSGKESEALTKLRANLREENDSDVKVGDRVLFGKYSGTEVKIDGEESVGVRQRSRTAMSRTKNTAPRSRAKR
jgi:hypothetical protein